MARPPERRTHTDYAYSLAFSALLNIARRFMDRNVLLVAHAMHQLGPSGTEKAVAGVSGLRLDEVRTALQELYTRGIVDVAAVYVPTEQDRVRIERPNRKRRPRTVFNRRPNASVYTLRPSDVMRFITALHRNLYGQLDERQRRAHDEQYKCRACGKQYTVFAFAECGGRCNKCGCDDFACSRDDYSCRNCSRKYTARDVAACNGTCTFCGDRDITSAQAEENATIMRLRKECVDVIGPLLKIAEELLSHMQTTERMTGQVAVV